MYPNPIYPRFSKMLSLRIPMNYVAMSKSRSCSPPEARNATWKVPAITKREKLFRLKALEEGPLPRNRLINVDELLIDLQNELYLYADMLCSRRSIEMTIGALCIVSDNLVKDFPKNNHADGIKKMAIELYKAISTCMFNPVTSRFESADTCYAYVEDMTDYIQSIIKWHSIEESESM